MRCAYLSRSIRILETLANPTLAGKWDNVGLLVDSLVHHDGKEPYHVFFTNDLTPNVLREAIAANARLIVTYHPTPFAALKKFNAENVPARIILECARNGIAVYSPHTALDAVPGGLNDWLLKGIVAKLAPGSSSGGSEDAVKCIDLRPIQASPDKEAALRGAGDGRIASISRPMPFKEIIDAVKAHLSLEHVQICVPPDLAKEAVMSSIAVVAGSGASILQGCTADVYVTGEMSHHEVLAASHAGACVILTHHSKCERPFTTHIFAAMFEKAWREAPPKAATTKNLEANSSRSSCISSSGSSGSGGSCSSSSSSGHATEANSTGGASNDEATPAGIICSSSKIDSDPLSIV